MRKTGFYPMLSLQVSRKGRKKRKKMEKIKEEGATQKNKEGKANRRTRKAEWKNGNNKQAEQRDFCFTS